jgi:amino acid transporter
MVQSGNDRTEFVRGLSLLDSTMLVAGNMIGPGIIHRFRRPRPSGRFTRMAAGRVVDDRHAHLIAALSYGDLAVPLALQGLWIVVLTLPRTYDPITHHYGNLHGNLLDHIIFGVLLFYILTMASLFVLRRKHPDRERPVRAQGHP